MRRSILAPPLYIGDAISRPFVLTSISVVMSLTSQTMMLERIRTMLITTLSHI